MRPVVDGLAQEVGWQYDVRVLNLSTGDASMQKLASELEVRYVPTFVFVGTDGRIGNTVVGAMTKDAMKAELAKLK
jgi:predicted DsbA family dithiol-disulfide isomerase